MSSSMVLVYLRGGMEAAVMSDGGREEWRRGHHSFIERISAREIGRRRSGGERGDAPEALPDQAVDLIVGNLGEDNLEEDLVGDGVLARAGPGLGAELRLVGRALVGGGGSFVGGARARTARRAREKEADARGRIGDAWHRRASPSRARARRRT